MLTRKVDGPKLREAREERELNGPQVVEEIEKLLGRRYDASTLYKVEKGERQPSARFFGALCRVLKRNKSEFLLPAKDAA